MSRRTTRKTVDYSHFNADSDSHGSDDDFQQSSLPHPSKKAKKKAVENSRSEKKNKRKQAKLSTEEQVRSTRKSRDEKQFEKELQQALEISMSQSREIIDDNYYESASSKSFDVSKDGSKPKEYLDEPSGLIERDNSDDDDQAISDKNDGCKDENKENDDDFRPSDDDLDDDEDEEEDFYAENDSDDEFHISDSKKRKLPAKSKNSVQKKKPNIGEISNRNTTKGKGTRKCSTSSSSAASVLTSEHSSLPQTCKRNKAALKTGRKSFTITGAPVSTQGNSPVQPRLSSGLAANGSPGLGGVVVKNARPGGLRLGLSRNVRIVKPLHSNISIK